MIAPVCRHFSFCQELQNIRQTIRLANWAIHKTGGSYSRHYCNYRLIKDFHGNTCWHQFFKRSLSTLPTPRCSSISGVHKYLWQNDENNNAEAYMRTTTGYKNTFFDPNKQPKNKVCHQVVHEFIQASVNNGGQPISCPSNKSTVDAVLSNLRELTDEELLKIIHHLRFYAPSEQANDPSYVRLWSALDAECVSRMSTWGLDFLFQTADVWYGVKLVRFSNFHKKFMLTLLKKCGRLKREHFIRFMYCLNLARTLPNYSAKYEIQDYLRTEVDTMNHQEASIVAMSCFKTETNIDDPVIVEKLLNIAISARQEIDYISISAVAKFARFTSSPKLKPVLIKLQEAFLPELGRLNVHSSVHLALVGTKTQLAHKPLLNAVVEIIQDNIESARLKDLERIALVMTMFDVDCDKLGWLIVEELASPRRTEEIKEYGRCLPAILHYLSIREIFPQNLINYVLGEKFVQTYYANTSEIYLRELLCLDFCAELEIVGYTGARLDKIARDKISKGHISRVSKPLGPKLSAYEVSLRKLTTILESFLGGPEYCVISNILPHHHCKKIIFCTDATGKPSPIPHHYRNLPEHEIKYLNGGDLQFHVMYACNRSDFIPSEKKLTGSGNLIIRQLKKLGYRVHVIFPPFTVTQVNDVMQKLL